MKEQINNTKNPDFEYQNGYSPFPDTIIVSTERSGINFIRHVVETFSGWRTPGIPHIYKTGPLLFHRTHCVHSPITGLARTNIHTLRNESKYKKIILILRDPREIFVRAYQKNSQRLLSYCWNINAFDRFDGEKHLVYYDDIVSGISALKSIFVFLGIESFFDESRIEVLRHDSVNWYDNYQHEKGGGSVTKGSPELLTYHQSNLTQEELDHLILILKKELGDRYTYLSRWINK